MKIKKIEIKSYRSLSNITIHPKGILALVGRNNSGKSNLIKALELFFSGSIRLVNEECFYNHKQNEPIEIFLTFDSLSNWEKEQFKSWMDDDKLIVGKEIICNNDSFEINTLSLIKVPKPDWLQEEKINGENIEEWWKNKGTLITNGIDFSKEFGTKKPKVSEWNVVVEGFIEKNKDKIEWEIQKQKNPKGYPNVLKGALPEFIYIPAVRDITDETKITQSNPFGQLINSILEKISGTEKEKIAEQLKAIEKKLNRIEGMEGERIEEIKQIENKLNSFICQLMECDIEIEMATPKLNEVFSGARIFANDGIRTPIETKGHGLQRSMIFTILRAYAELSHIKKADKKANERTTIFAIEEPELYLHPQSQRTLMSVLEDISKGNDQVIYSTHSSVFVDIANFDQICIMRREKKEDCFKTCPTQLTMEDFIEDLKITEGVTANEEGIRERFYNLFNSMINEGFFADKVVIVEGGSEQVSFPIYANALNYNFDKHNVSVVHSDGKGPMVRLLKVFNGFKIPTYVIFDGDKIKGDKTAKNNTMDLLKILSDPVEKIEDLKTKITDKYTVFENDFETILRHEIEDYEKILTDASKELGKIGKPLKHKYLANTLNKKIDETHQATDILPDTVINIIDKIEHTSFQGPLLKKS